MIKIKSNEYVKNFDNENMKWDGKDLLYVRGFAAVLMLRPRSKDPIRDMSLAKKLLENEGKDIEVELDIADVKDLKEAVNSYDGFTNLAIAQLLEKLGV